MSEALIKSCLAFSSPQDEAQLRELDHVVGTSNPATCGLPEFQALLSIFERFPNDDGFGVFWSIVHFLEACKGYETVLVESVKRKPVEFNLTMVNRLLNAGELAIEGTSLLALLSAVAADLEIDPSVRKTASRFLAYQKEHGRA